MNIDLIPDPTQKYVETTGLSMYSDGVCIENYCIIFDRKKGIKIPLLTPDARLYYQLIPKELLIVMLETYLPEILANINIGELILKQKSESGDKK